MENLIVEISFLVVVQLSMIYQMVEQFKENSYKKPITPYENKINSGNDLARYSKISKYKMVNCEPKIFNPIGAHHRGIIGEDLNFSSNIFLNY